MSTWDKKNSLWLLDNTWFFSNLTLILETKYIPQSKGKPKANYHLGIMQSMKSHCSEESPWEIKKYLVSGPLQTV